MGKRPKTTWYGPDASPERSHECGAPPPTGAPAPGGGSAAASAARAATAAALARPTNVANFAPPMRRSAARPRRKSSHSPTAASARPSKGARLVSARHACEAVSGPSRNARAATASDCASSDAAATPSTSACVSGAPAKTGSDDSFGVEERQTWPGRCACQSRNRVTYTASLHE